MKLRLELIARIEEILKKEAQHCSKEFLLEKMFNFFDEAILIEFVEYLENRYGQDMSNLN